MKFAKDAEGKRILPFKHGRGICPVCESTVIARCGNKRAHHWAHESLVSCAYTEYEHTHETPWHINWKNHFPSSWQEIILRSPEGEKHISDVRTPHGLTIEFQHSPISEEERISREKFYSSEGGMVWVVDGTKSKHDWNRWYNSRLLRESSCVLSCGGRIIENAKEMLPAEWLRCAVPVFFDFLGTEPEDEAIPEKKELVCILSSKDQQKHLVIPIQKELFIELCKTEKLLPWIKGKEAPKQIYSLYTLPPISIPRPIQTPRHIVQPVSGGVLVNGIFVPNPKPRKRNHRL